MITAADDCGSKHWLHPVTKDVPLFFKTDEDLPGQFVYPVPLKTTPAILWDAIKLSPHANKN